MQQSFIEGVGFGECLPQLISNESIFDDNYPTFSNTHIFFDDGDEMFLKVMEKGFFMLDWDLGLRRGLI